jgi:hypothetical protein
LGYSLRVQGRIVDREGEFGVGIGRAAQAKHGFQVGDIVRGESYPVGDPRMEPVDLYRTSGLKLLERREAKMAAPPPWIQKTAPELEVYRERGHRRLGARTYDTKCVACIWGCRMAVEIIVDHWNPRKKRYRFESFCYGPKSCLLYRAGPPRKVPGRRGLTWEEEDWVDEEETSHRGLED